MGWVSRNASGTINGVFANRQDGYAEEYLDSDSAEVVAFLNPNPVPTITKAQALLYLLSNGKTEADVEAELAKLDSYARAVAEIEWRYRLTFHHDHPLFSALGPLLGITDMEAAFRIAATL